jgi:hypothetical protein
MIDLIVVQIFIDPSVNVIHMQQLLFNMWKILLKLLSFMVQCLWFVMTSIQEIIC